MSIGTTLQIVPVLLPDRRAAGLALQRGLGLLSNRGLGLVPIVRRVLVLMGRA